MLRTDAGRGWNDRCIQGGRATRCVGRNAGSWRHDGIERNRCARLITCYVSRRGSNHVGRKAGNFEGRVHALCWRRSGIGLESEQVGNGFIGGGKLEVRSIDHLRRQRSAASHANRLSAVTCFLASGAARSPGLRSTQVFGARQFVAGIVNHFIGFQLRRRVGSKLVDLLRKNDHHKQQERLQQPRSEDAHVRENSVRGFASQAFARAPECRPDGGDEILPARRPFDQQLGRIVELNDHYFVELESHGQGVSVLRLFEGDESKLLNRLLHLDFDAISQCSSGSGHRVAG